VIATRICSTPPRVMAAIHFDDEARRRCDKITNETPQRRLTAKPDAQRAAANRKPEPLL
jgi:hypothetical protein